MRQWPPSVGPEDGKVREMHRYRDTRFGKSVGTAEDIVQGSWVRNFVSKKKKKEKKGGEGGETSPPILLKIVIFN